MPEDDQEFVPGRALAGGTDPNWDRSVAEWAKVQPGKAPLLGKKAHRYLVRLTGTGEML